MHLLLPLILTSWLYFCLVLKISVLGLIISLAIIGIELIGKKIIISLLGQS